MKTVLQILGTIIFITIGVVIIVADINMWIMGGVTIILVIVIRIIKRIISNYKFNKKINAEHSPEELKKLITNIAAEGSDDMGPSEVSKIKVWKDEMIVKIDAGELKTIADMAKYIDGKAPIMKSQEETIEHDITP